MNMRILSLCAIFFLTVCSSLNADYPFALRDIRDFSKSEKSALAKRYEAYRANPELFSFEQFEVIASKGLAQVISNIILHQHIKLSSPQELIEYAQIIVESGFSFLALEWRIVKYLKDDEKEFDALTKAVKRERRFQWKRSRVQEVKDRGDTLVTQILNGNLNEDDKLKVIDIYAICIAAYAHPEDRLAFQPRVCKPMKGFEKPRFTKTPASTSDIPTPKTSDRGRAYLALIAQARFVAEGFSLGDLERVVMAKCISENALRFFKPFHHLGQAACKEIKRTHESPDEAFFETTGVCSNFSGIAYNVAKDLGLDGRVYLARKGFHVYLEFESAGAWYHTHPFSGQGKCDVVQY